MNIYLGDDYFNVLIEMLLMMMNFMNFIVNLRDLIEDTNYNIDIVDCLTALHCAMEDFEMYA